MLSYRYGMVPMALNPVTSPSVQNLLISRANQFISRISPHFDTPSAK